MSTPPEKEKLEKFWKGVFEDQKEQTKEAEWIPDLEKKKQHLEEMPPVIIDEEKRKKNNQKTTFKNAKL